MTGWTLTTCWRRCTSWTWTRSISAGEDCRGVCPECGKDLNEGPCSCRKKADPRLAVLEQLLDK
ncbi:MAG: YceD family protein [Lachnospiraceae bacterium]